MKVNSAETWNNCLSPCELLQAIKYVYPWDGIFYPYSVSLRQQRLIVCACALRCNFLLSDEVQQLILNNERHCDGLEPLEVSTGVLPSRDGLVRKALSQLSSTKLYTATEHTPLLEALRYLLVDGFLVNNSTNLISRDFTSVCLVRACDVALIIRDIVPNPYRQLVARYGINITGQVYDNRAHHVFDNIDHWFTPAVHGLVESIYQHRDHTLLPILGDALQEAGCTDQEVLEHCYRGSPHVHGCWLLELLKHSPAALRRFHDGGDQQ